MVGREWKSGDVGVNTKYGYRGIYVASCAQHNRPYGCWHNESGLADSIIDPRRPLVVIDPEDREQVERLWQAWRDLAPDHCLAQDNMQDALRSLIADPKPAEPMGLGAVVEDADGCQFVRRAIDWTDSPWVPARAAGFYEWADIAAVKVLHEGVTQ